jgi:hypothetical protein
MMVLSGLKATEGRATGDFDFPIGLGAGDLFRGSLGVSASDGVSVLRGEDV